MTTSSSVAMGLHPLGDATPHDRATQEEAEGAEAGGDGEPRRAGRSEPDQDHVAGHVGDEHVPETEEAHRIEEPAHDGEGGQSDHEGLWRMIGLAHVRSTFPATRRRSRPSPT